MATQPSAAEPTAISPTSSPHHLKLLDARRNQLFGNQPVSGPAQCPLKATELAIFPIRYALDELPPKGSSQGPNPLPPGWSASHLPRLEARSYTLRQLRDGWLYVWDETRQELHEYSVCGHEFTRHKWSANELFKDERNNPGDTRPYLLYPRSSRLSLAFSPMQWTWRICERMRSNPSLRTAWMRSVDLPDFCATMTLPHGGPLDGLGEATADILPGRSPDFLTTHAPTRPSGDPDDNRPLKPIIDEALVIGNVPEKDDALFVALDDPLAIVEDLLMHLAGRRMEQAQFEEEHRHKLETAMVVQQLCGVELDDLMPAAVKDDPAQRGAFIQDAQALMDAQDMDTELALRNNAPFMNSAEMAMAATEYLDDLADRERAFQEKWGVAPRGPAWVDAQKRFNQRAAWRSEVKFAEAEQFLHDSEATLKRFEAHGQLIEVDLSAWLIRLGRDPLTFFHDPCMPGHSTALLELASSVALHMGGSQSGQQWLCEEFKGGAQRAKTLLGTALVNFDPELEALIARVVDEFAHSQQLDISGQGDGGGQAYTGVSEASNVAGRLNETKSVLDLDTVKNSAFYRSASEWTRRGFEVLLQGLRQEALKSWLMLSELTLPALPRERLLSFVALQVVASEETFTRIQLSVNPDYAAQYDDWHKRTKALLREIHIEQGLLSRPSTAQAKRDARLQLAAKCEQLRLLMLEEPQRLVGKLLTQTRQLGMQEQAYASWLSDLGRGELKAQWALKAQNALQHPQRLKAWVDLQVDARGGALPLTVAALNLWNLKASWQQASRDGTYSEAELRVISSNMAYTANALMALWTMPMWSRYAKDFGEINRRSTELARAGVRAWAKEGNVAFARIARSLVLRTMAFAAFGTIAAGLEAWQVSKDIERAASREEAAALTWKKYALLGMATLSGAQLAGSIVGTWLSFAWVMGPAITILILAAGLVYLLSSLYANLFKREGLRLWLHRCAWGKLPEPKWQGDQGHANEMQALTAILLRPTVLARRVDEYRTSFSGNSVVSVPIGFWLQILLPAEAANGPRSVELQAAMVETRWFGLGQDRLLSQSAGFYDQFVSGHWAPLDQLGQLPASKGNGSLPSDAQYGPDDTHRLWQTWVSYNAPPVLELEVSYPSEALERKQGQRGYQFRIDISSSTGEAERKNTAFGFEPSEEMLLSQHPTQKLRLPIP